MSRKVILFVLVFLMAAALIPAFPRAQAQDPLKIGLLVDQSGALTIYGYELEQGFKLGLLYAAGVKLADHNNSLDEALKAVTIAGRPVEVIMRDNGSKPDDAATQARELIEQEGVEILVGAPSSGVMTGVQQVALDSDVILFAAPAASPAITGANFNVNTFRVCRNTFQDFLAFAPYAKENLKGKFVILAIDNDFGKASAGAAQGVLGGAGIEFVGAPIYAPLDTTDFTPYLQQVLASGATAMLPIWAGDSSVTLFQQIAELGVGEKLAVVAAFNSNDIVAKSDPSTIGNISWIVYHYSFPTNDINTWMVNAHKAVYNDVPDLFTECSFATAQALVNAVTTTKGDATPEAMIPALEGLVFEGPKGTYAIRPSDHQALVPMYVAKLANLTDPDQKFYELLAEVPAKAIIPPVLLPEAILADRVKLDEAFMKMIAEMP
ncbi:MAG TPA: substrate-binding domain-containing protein [Aggregatilineales bacterium]|nr:substrate-binding domain-containing protein [Anaerolineales bacterium]HRE48727.1 substrate-binding domain-containing protein [Aggregatilineales bacterium]